MKPFTFYFDGSFYKGMNHQGRLYKLVEAFIPAQRSTAFVCACKLATQGLQTIITASDKSYGVWTDLRFASHVAVEQPEVEGSCAMC
ncbi:hypothetical protein H6G89_09505 [Oscillatoria sp. FACHB-1407]|uniref:hypothetical protein n=1 Tax=Oscillatoria sp. FACHB-1407 TaxID=2692847 RepID=UPI0016880E30|nr:hypothetical protein [Oscillatoria sp. FACHB-1407]MBD2461281.1 hypothetical protein [Oscillatoria sp. FACHB-1407]